MISYNATWQTPQQMVREFHEAMGLEIRDDTVCRMTDQVRLRKALMKEEFDEYMEAEWSKTTVEVAEELADIVYIAYGTALTYGIPLDKVIAEKHKSNMSKLDDDGNPIKREDGKVLKGPNFKPADIKKVLYGG